MKLELLKKYVLLTPEEAQHRLLHIINNYSHSADGFSEEDALKWVRANTVKEWESVLSTMVTNEDFGEARCLFFAIKRHRDSIKSYRRKTRKDVAKANSFKKEFLDKVILPKEHKIALFEALTQENMEKRAILFHKWGFDEFEKGKGLVFMFYGPPGTGKTLCAEMIAKYLDKDHFIMTTADIQSSVPGQAERNIKEVFEKANKGNHVVVIDECDSLLYERNAVGAIMAAEINCLLSEIERFHGVCVLTTNRNKRLDPALERRIALKLHFDNPDATLRKVIWKTLVPKKCPLSSDVCFDTLAKYDLTGGNIKNVIFSAARRALYSDRKKVRMDDFKEGVRQEFASKSAFKGYDDGQVHQRSIMPTDVAVNTNSNRMRTLEKTSSTKNRV